METIDGFSLGVAFRILYLSPAGPEGTPAPGVGEAVHLELSDNCYYEGNGFNRRNIVGIKNPVTGEIIAKGLCPGFTSLTPGKDYYLRFYSGTYYQFAYAINTPDVWRPIRTTAAFRQSMRFPGTAGRMFLRSYLRLKKFGSPTYNVIAQIQGDDASNHPNGTVYAESEHIPASEIDSGTDGLQVALRWLDTFKQSGVKYHIVLTADTDVTNDTDYVAWGGEDSGAYADGSRCSDDGTGVWTEDATDDLDFTHDYIDIDAGMSGDITDVHPFDDVDPELTLYRPIIKVGRAISVDTLEVDLQVMPVKILLDDWSTVLSETSSSYKRQRFSLVSSHGCERLIVLYKIGLSNNQWSCRGFRHASFSAGVNNRQQLQFKLKYTTGTPNSTGTAIPIWSGRDGEEGEVIQPGSGTVYVGKVTVFGA